MLERSKRKRIEWAFYNYPALKQQGAEYLVELAERGVTAKYGGLGVHSSEVSNPTESKGIKAAEGSSAALWCKVVENTITAFRWEYEYSIIDLHYFKKKTHSEIWNMLNLPESTYFFWLNRVLETAEMWANSFGL